MSNRRNTERKQFGAANLLAFLRDTFDKMPPAVQIFGWLVVLFLLVFVVLHPLLGVTYIDGEVVRYDRTPDGETRSSPYRDLMIRKGVHTITNRDGAFTLRLHGPILPFAGVGVDFGPDGSSERIALHGPVPLLSLFNPNATRIFYLQDSRTRDEFGVLKHYFTDRKEFRDALDSSKRSASSRHRTLRGLVRASPFRVVGTAHATEHRHHVPSRTLRVRMLELRGLPDPVDVSLRIRVAGKPIAGRLPYQGSMLSHLTLFPDIPIAFEALDIPIPPSGGLVNLELVAPGRFRDQQVASLEFNANSWNVGKVVRIEGDNVVAELELLPAVKIASVVVYPIGSYTRQYVFWLDGEDQYRDHISSVSYDMGSWASIGNLSYPEITPESYYSVLWRGPGEIVVRGTVHLQGGSTIQLERKLDADMAEPKSWRERLFLARANCEQPGAQTEKCLELAGRALEEVPNSAYALSVRAEGLVQRGEFDDAIQASEGAIALEPQNASILNSYAWRIVEQLPDPTEAQLRRAKTMALRAVNRRPALAHLDTLGWVHFKLGDYEEALQVFSRAREQAERTQSHDRAVEIAYHLGEVYLQLGRDTDAAAQFSRVVSSKYGWLYPPSVESATAHLERLERKAKDLSATEVAP